MHGIIKISRSGVHGTNHFYARLMWVRVLLKDLGLDQVAATWVWENDQGAIGLAIDAGYIGRPSTVTFAISLSMRTWLRCHCA